jgi:hypothetical protein
MKPFRPALAADGVLAATATLVDATTSAPDKSDVAAKVPMSCSGMVEPIGATSLQPRKSTPLPGRRTLELRSADINGVQYAWSRVIPSSVAGDRIWIDISGTGGSTWSQFGMRRLGSTGRNYTKALRTSSNSQVVMRAGFRPYNVGTSYLTDWWVKAAGRR